MTIDVQVLVVALLAAALAGFNIALAWTAWNDRRTRRHIEEAIRNELVR